MPIALDSENAGQSYGAATSFTRSHTCTGTNRILMVGLWVSENTTDVVTGVTYAGVSMTRVDSQLLASGGNGYTYLYYLVAPATGANNIVASLSASKTGVLHAVSYTEAAQSGQMDSSAKSTGGPGASTKTFTTTTVADNCWIVMACRYDGAAQAAGAGTTYRGTEYNFRMADSNGAKTPAGAYSLIFNATNSSFAGVIASIKPYVAPTGHTKNLLTLNVG